MSKMSKNSLAKSGGGWRECRENGQAEADK